MAGGRPSKYNATFHPQLVKFMKMSGMINRDVAKALFISEPTLHGWAKSHPEFKHALKDSGDFIDHLVEGSLLKRALGYTYVEVEEYEVLNRKTKKLIKTKIKTVEKTVLPDTTACIFWLKNRQRDKWKDRWEFTGDGGGPIVVNVAEVDQRLKDKLKIIEAEIVKDKK